MNSEQLKKLSVQVMVGSLIGAAVLAVIAVLAGSFNEVFAKSLFTLGLVMMHALASLAFIGQSSKNNVEDLKFFNNSVFVIIVLSFFTSIFGIWEIFPGSLVAKLYGTYGILLFASLHGEMIAKTTGKQSNIDKIVYSNYIFMGIVILLILPLIWISDFEFGGFYYRLLAAAGIVDATLTILAVILHKLYIQKHPEEQSTIFSVVTTMDPNGNPIPVQAEVQQKRRMNPLVMLLGIFLIGQLVLSALFAILGAFYRRSL